MTDAERDELLVELKTKFESVEEKMEKVYHVLIEGNGTPAMVVRVALAEQEIERIKEERTDKKMPRAAWVGIVISGVFSLVAIIQNVV